MKILKLNHGRSVKWHFCWVLLKETIERNEDKKEKQESEDSEKMQGTVNKKIIQVEALREDSIAADTLTEMREKLSEIFRNPYTKISGFPETDHSEPVCGGLSSDCERILKEAKKYCLFPHARKEIAHSVGFSENYISRIFKQGFGVQISSYLRQKRLMLARGKVRHTDLQFDEIGKVAGYKHPSSFSAAYKKEYGLTPTQDRNRYLER